MTGINFNCSHCGQSIEAAPEFALEEVTCPDCQQPIYVPAPGRNGPRVFISYAAADRAVADRICGALEGEGFSCWIAPRDITPGMEWGAAIIDGIDRAALMVVVCSGDANRSKHVIRELERAVNKGVIILPFRIADVPLSRSMEYFLSNAHWLDAFTQPFDHHLETLRHTVVKLLADTATPASGLRHTFQAPSSPPSRSRWRLWAGIASGTAAVAALAGSALYFANPFGSEEPQAATEVLAATEKVPPVENPAPMPEPESPAPIQEPPPQIPPAKSASVEKKPPPPAKELEGAVIGPWELRVDSYELADSFAAGKTEVDAADGESIAVVGLTLSEQRDYNDAELLSLRKSEFGANALKSRELLDSRLVLSAEQFFIGHLRQGSSDPDLIVSRCKALRIDSGRTIPGTQNPSGPEDSRIDFATTQDIRTGISLAFSVKEPAPPALLIFSPTLKFKELSGVAIFPQPGGPPSSVDYHPEKLFARIASGELPALTDPPIPRHPYFRFPAPDGTHEYEIEFDVRSLATDSEGSPNDTYDSIRENVRKLTTDASRFDLRRNDHAEAFGNHVIETLGLGWGQNRSVDVVARDPTSLNDIILGRINVTPVNPPSIDWNPPPKDRSAIETATIPKSPLPTEFIQWKNKSGDFLVEAKAISRSDGGLRQSLGRPDYFSVDGGYVRFERRGGGLVDISTNDLESSQSLHLIDLLKKHDPAVEWVDYLGKHYSSVVDRRSYDSFYREFPEARFPNLEFLGESRSKFIIRWYDGATKLQRLSVRLESPFAIVNDRFMIIDAGDPGDGTPSGKSTPSEITLKDLQKSKRQGSDVTFKLIARKKTRIPPPFGIFRGNSTDSTLDAP